jgi:hypothetical protein
MQNVAKRLLAMVLTALMVSSFFVTSNFAKPNAEKEAQLAARVKAAVAKVGTGPSARIEIKLSDGTRLKGHVSETAEDHFVIVDDKTGAATAVPYPQVKQVRGNNLSTGAKIVIGVAVVIGVLALVGWLARGS